MMTIPFSVEGAEKECLIQIRDLVDNRVIADIFHGRCQPGTHTAEFDPEIVFKGLDAGYYALYVIIGEEVESYPLQYMP